MPVVHEHGQHVLIVGHEKTSDGAEASSKPNVTNASGQRDAASEDAIPEREATASVAVKRSGAG